ncbi:CCHC-type zinc finger transcription factor [Phycomyces blakesleeanus NRRL 1555(-)]|uniref:CCHC-type zinc finger transcription factor n=1 Tax=Phycomyces blakesleeanus (strain ATCC 8743b / DSM 1359 / FGSC 10004 / NBRC 33097 / NRRL 1555) TaxID=763407 RepID=A0A162X1P1_PHYB8|nr:CCHC-type zinc finger transcription factor [Phycomyces blakesleeanus NRRL 1555(-)]OAD72015.1 CCHC-type zinc finger transcription factor [Phycomyces blakesleeanus NRRL 1555(-)]|eukprot:XP_018290055.1 CCHC-type zinc finger transcription factor [Phycomyces blakesleeanus NRRL 1555(-)]
MDFDDNMTFLTTWLNMGVHCTLCQTMGHDYDNCHNPPKETYLCYGCHQVGHFCSKCPRAAEVDNPYKWDYKANLVDRETLPADDLMLTIDNLAEVETYFEKNCEDDSMKGIEETILQ